MDIKKLNKSQLQIIAAVAMLLDHCSVFCSSFILYTLFRTIGKITVIIMCYFIAEGYYKSSDVKKYAVRLGVFAIISQLPFYYYKTVELPNNLYLLFAGSYFSRNVIFTLFVALCLLIIIKSNYHWLVKAVAVGASVYLVRCSDWRWYVILFVLAFGLFREDTKMQIKVAAMVIAVMFFERFSGFIISASVGNLDIMNFIHCFTSLGGFLALPLILMYNGEKGCAPKYFFYIFYPLHLTILYLIELLVF